MAYPASEGSLNGLFNTANGVAVRIKERVQAVSDMTQAGATQRRMLRELQLDLSRAIATFNDAASKTGMAQYAKDQFGDQGLDVAAEFNAMISQATTLRDWIFNNFPKDQDSGAVLLETLNTDGSTTSLMFSSAQTADFRTQALLFTATIG